MIISKQELNHKRIKKEKQELGENNRYEEALNDNKMK